ncbi:MAG: energy-coupled thiamine transporter ThiT [Firmicutes bacterium]|nr:energy-coupled thiamine transporter ThiT [Bacillota bacterium]
MRDTKTKIMVEGAVMVALATALSFIPIIQLPWGGTVTLLSMLPIAIFSIRRGIRPGLAVSFLYALIQFAQGAMKGLFGWGLTPGMLIACIFLDYIGAFFVLGLAGIFRKKNFPGWMGGITLAVCLRFLFHFLSGVVIWHSVGELWKGFSTDNTYLYSFLYNGCYMLPELVLTLAGAAALLTAPQTKKLIILPE